MKTPAKAITIGLVAVALSIVVAVIGVALFSWGAAELSDRNDKPTTEQETAAAARVLVQRPPMEETKQQLESTVMEIAAVASELAPEMRWGWNRDETSSRCGKPYDMTRGYSVTLRNYVSSTPIPEPVWPTFLARVSDIAAKAGATVPSTMQNTPDATGTPANHDVWFSNQENGTLIKVGSQKAAVISATTGCRLDRADFANPIRGK
ncbi:LppA family lipoprotein [Nocardia sp. NPDC050712]|uniref:LppA family lipoprotein n=1 Tax=Nocardia sp. NPDC050712 TaxID=3155518 RepID=UPI0033EDE654